MTFGGKKSKRDWGGYTGNKHVLGWGGWSGLGGSVG